MSEKEIRPVSRKSDLVTQELEKEILIYDQIIDKAFSLNETSSLIWILCTGKYSISEIAANLSEKLNSPINEDFVWLALEQLKKHNLLENSEEISTDFGGLSRRDVIRKIGFASLVTLPMILTLVAPTAAQTGSECIPPLNRGTNAVCTQSCQCGPTSAGNPQCCRPNASNNLRCLTTSGATANSVCLTP